MQTQENKKNGVNKGAASKDDGKRPAGATANEPSPATDAATAGSTPDQNSGKVDKPELTMAQKKAHLETYQDLHDKVTVAEEELEASRVALRDHAKVIFEAMGPGPFGWRGGKVKIAKAKGGGYTFRGEDPTDVEPIG
jgi:hypothetical protein